MEIALTVLRWVLSPFLWLRKAWLMLRELRTHEQQIESARDLLARELRQNALLIEEYDEGKWSLGHLQTNLRAERWQQGATEWSALRPSNKDLWSEIADSYEEIERLRATGSAAEPPSSARLHALADRLDEAHI